MSAGNFATTARIQSAADGAVPQVPQSVWFETPSVKNFGAVGDGVANDTAALAAAFALGGFILLPPGIYYVSASAASTPVFALSTRTTIVGEHAKIVYHPGSGNTNSHLFKATADNCEFHGIEIENFSGSSTNGVGTTGEASGCHSIQFDGVAGGVVKDCILRKGHYAVSGVDSSDLDISGNRMMNVQSSGVHFLRCSNSAIERNRITDVGSDGIKITGGEFTESTGLSIRGNITRLAGRDGIDTYDGLRHSVVDGNVSVDCLLNGFEFKGTPSDVRYVNVANIFSNNLSIGAGAAGFNIASVRRAQMNGNMAIGSVLSGFIFTTCQQISAAGCSAFANGEHGVKWSGTQRHSTYSSLLAFDNGYTDGSGAASNFSGFFASGDISTCRFTDLLAYNGTMSGEQGGQKWGLDLSNDAAGAVFLGGFFYGQSGGIGSTQGGSNLLERNDYVNVNDFGTRRNYVYLPETTINAAAGDTTSNLVSAMVFGAVYHVRLQETVALNGDANRSFSLGDGTTPDLFLAAVTATGSAVGYAVVDGSLHVGKPLRVTVTNNAGATAGTVAAKVVVK